MEESGWKTGLNPEAGRRTVRLEGLYSENDGCASKTLIIHTCSGSHGLSVGHSSYNQSTLNTCLILKYLLILICT